MEEFLAKTDLQIPLTMALIFIIPFAFGIALFHTLILSSMYGRKIQPSWILYAIYPSILILLSFVRTSYAMLLLIFLFLSTFAMVILGLLGSMVYSIVKGIKKEVNRKDAKKPLWLRILLNFVAVAIGLLLLSTGPLSIFLTILAVIIFKILFPDYRSKLLKFQAALPTSKIGSLAMGLVEVEGRLRMIEPMEAPMKKKKCIGYKYTIESISTDSDGDKSYQTIVNETKCQRFFIEDETGKIEINPEKIELTGFGLDEQYSSGSRRYTQYLIFENENVLLIGKGNEEDGKPVITYEEVLDVFAMTPVGNITLWNKFKPVRDQLIVYGCFVAFLFALVLAVPIRIENGMVFLTFGWKLFLWNF